MLTGSTAQVISDTNVAAGALAIDGKKMILVSKDGIINLWDVATQSLPGGAIQVGRPPRSVHQFRAAGAKRTLCNSSRTQRTL